MTEMYQEREKLWLQYQKGLFHLVTNTVVQLPDFDHHFIIDNEQLFFQCRLVWMDCFCCTQCNWFLWQLRCRPSKQGLQPLGVVDMLTG